MQNYEKIIKENMKQTTIIEKRKETVENFKSTNFLKDCKHFHLIDQVKTKKDFFKALFLVS